MLSFLISLYYFVSVDFDDLTNLRMDFYEGENNFQNTYLNTFYASFLLPLLIVSLCYFCVSNHNDNKLVIILGFVALLLDGFIRQGRFQIFYVFFYLIIFKNFFNVRKIHLFVCFLVAVVLSFYTLYTRYLIKDVAINSMSEFIGSPIFYNSSINYQLYGYVFLDKLVESVDFTGHYWELNSVSFAFYALNTLFLTKINLFLHYPWENYNLILAQGMYSEHLLTDFNAFSTNFYPIFLDFGFIGIAFYALMSGFFTAIKTESMVLRILKALNIFILLFGIYQPIIIYLTGFVYVILGVFFFLFFLLMKLKV